jgi:hypothetical protein
MNNVEIKSPEAHKDDQWYCMPTVAPKWDPLKGTRKPGTVESCNGVGFWVLEGRGANKRWWHRGG